MNEGEQVTLLIRQFGEAFADVCVSVSTQSGTAVGMSVCLSVLKVELLYRYVCLSVMSVLRVL